MPQSPEYYTLTSFLAGHTRIVGKALDDFCSPVEKKFLDLGNVAGTDNIQNLLYVSWPAVASLAKESPHESRQRERLVEFMINLAYRPTPLKDNKPCVVSGMTLWRDLPIFGWELRDSWNFDPSDEKALPNDQWVNLNAWTSSFVAEILENDIDWLDYSILGLWSIRSGLEEEKDPVDVLVEGAAVWFIYSGEALYTFCSENKSFDGKVAIPGSLFKDQDWNGFSMNRWEAWTKQLDDLESSSLGEQAKKLVNQALEAIRVFSNS